MFTMCMDPCRLVLSALLIVVGIISSIWFDSSAFKVQVTVPDVPTYDNCVLYCQKWGEDGLGKGLCVDSDLRFQVCHKDGLKTSDCITVNNEPLTDEENKRRARRCQFMVVRPLWLPLTVTCVFIFCIVLVVQGLPAQVVLLGGAAVLAFVGALERSKVYAGAANRGVITLAVLFPIAAAVEETGFLEKAVGILLGKPTNLNSALMRMMLSVAFLSAFLSNTATVALMIPIVLTWSRRLDVHPGKMMMPLSFAAQLGGSTTLLGSSHCLVAKTVVRSLYDMEFFDLFPIGLVLTFAITALIIPLAGTNVLRSSLQTDDSESVNAASNEYYRVMCVVHSNGVGGTIDDSGLRRVKGVADVRLKGTTDANSEENENAVLKAGDTLEVWCRPEGIMSLRRTAGLELTTQDLLDHFGGNRRERFLYEVTLDANSAFLEKGALQNSQNLLWRYGAVWLAGPHVEVGEKPRQPKAGDVLLFEVVERFIESEAMQEWHANTTLIMRIPRSNPPRGTRPVDMAKSCLVFLGFMALIACSTIKSTGVKLEIGGMVLLVVLISARCITEEQMFGSIKVSILLIIAGALAFGDALRDAGVVDKVSQAVLGFAAPLGPPGVIVVIYFLAVFLSMFINNSATIAILGPLIVAACEQDPQNDIKKLTWTLTYAAGSCFTTPLGYQTNLMVMPGGRYSFIDFARFGATVQLAHMVLTIALVYLFADFFPPFDGDYISRIPE